MQITDELLRDVAAGAFGRETEELLQILNLAASSEEHLPSYEPLLNRVKEVLVTRYDSEYVTFLLKYHLVPRRDIILRNTGYPK